MNMQRVLCEAEISELWPGMQIVSKTTFDSSEVPSELQELVCYAELWGQADDWAREDALQRTPAVLKENLKWIINTYDEQLDNWLGGTESRSPNPSDAYVAFSAMRMAADSL